MQNLIIDILVLAPACFKHAPTSVHIKQAPACFKMSPACIKLSKHAKCILMTGKAAILEPTFKTSGRLLKHYFIILFNLPRYKSLSVKCILMTRNVVKCVFFLKQTRACYNWRAPVLQKMKTRLSESATVQIS